MLDSSYWNPIINKDKGTDDADSNNTPQGEFNKII